VGRSRSLAILGSAARGEEKQSERSGLWWEAKEQSRPYIECRVQSYPGLDIRAVLEAEPGAFEIHVKIWLDFCSVSGDTLTNSISATGFYENWRWAVFRCSTAQWPLFFLWWYPVGVGWVPTGHHRKKMKSKKWSTIFTPCKARGWEFYKNWGLSRSRLQPWGPVILGYCRWGRYIGAPNIFFILAKKT
jgi:hypothetical protein